MQLIQKMTYFGYLLLIEDELFQHSFKQTNIINMLQIKIVNHRPLTKVSQPLFLGLQMIYLKSYYSRIAHMLEVVR